MSHLPWQVEGQFWRGNLHCHSTRSDGALSPKDVCRCYQEAGYHFVALTDHFQAQFDFPVTDTQGFRNGNFTTLLGAELHTGSTEFGALWEILAVGLPLDFAPTMPDETGTELAARALKAGAFVAAAHPHYYALTERDVLALGAIHAIEVYNGGVEENERADSWYLADLLLNQGHHYHMIATDDAHFVGNTGHDFMRGWVYVKSPELTPDALLDSLKAGHYYATTGPQIFDILVHPQEKITVRCTPAESVVLSGSTWQAVSVKGHGLMEVELPLAEFASPYGRVTVRDRFGRRAWSNPIWFA
jgi:histidinol phosphatase-like PHP family hydrolase